MVRLDRESSLHKVCRIDWWDGRVSGSQAEGKVREESMVKPQGLGRKKGEGWADKPTE
jgi:hypothetical protein